MFAYNGTPAHSLGRLPRRRRFFGQRPRPAGSAPAQPNQRPTPNPSAQNSGAQRPAGAGPRRNISIYRSRPSPVSPPARTAPDVKGRPIVVGAHGLALSQSKGGALSSSRRPSPTQPPAKRGPGRGRPPVRRGPWKQSPDLRAPIAQVVASPAPSKQQVRLIVVGGNEEVGRNMTLLEYGEDIILIDCGLQFPEEDMPGIDYIIPNISYLRGKESRVRGVVITHGHYDHIGAIPHLIPQLGYPPVFGTPLTIGLIKKRQDDYGGLANFKLNVVKSGQSITLGAFKLEFLLVSHNIPGSLAVIIDTPFGKIVHTGDFKIDLNPAGDLPPDIARIRKLGSENVLALLSDSTNASVPGRQFSETEIHKNTDEIIGAIKGRLIVGTFSSNIGRVQQILDVAEKHNRKVLVQGFSMKSNVEIAHELGYLKFKKGLLISENELKDIPDNRLMVLCTGAQGEGRAQLMRIANDEHRLLRIQKNDTVIFSSSVVPGNERTVQRLTDTLYRKGAKVINYRMMDIHAGGHAKQEDLKEMCQMIKPKYLVPIEGNHSFLHHHREAVVAGGFPEERVLIAENGQVMIADAKGFHLTEERIPSDYVFVDGLGVGDVSEVVLRDRQTMAADGMLVIIATVEARSGKLVGNPEIVSRGFVHVRESRKLIEDTKQQVKLLLKDTDPRSSANSTYLRDKLRDDIGQFLFQKTERRPLILPVIMEV